MMNMIFQLLLNIIQDNDEYDFSILLLNIIQDNDEYDFSIITKYYPR